MIIKCISDTHNNHLELDQSSLESDILIHCGDFGTKGTYSEAASFLYWFVKQPAKYKILVPGNHDKKIKEHQELLKLVHDLGISMLMNDSLTINNLNIYGGHFVCGVRNGIYTVEEDVRRSAWKNIPKDLDILVTHMPPYGILDTNEEGEHIGCDMLLEKVNEVKPKYHLFGHVHEHSYETFNNEDTEFINCAVKNRMYITIQNKPYEIRIPDDFVF